MDPNKRWLCYALTDHPKQQSTYTGQTNNWTRRLRQHNGEIKGGARSTRGRAWVPLFHVHGFRSLRAVLQFEYAMKRRKVPVAWRPGGPSPALLRGPRGGLAVPKARTRGPGGRVRQLEYLLSLGRLNDEPHSHFARNRLEVHCFMSKDRYLAWAHMSEDTWESTRRAQGVAFKFLK